jgi:uncharacterized membrane protein YwaF
MEWGFFTPAHIISLIAAAAMNIALYFAVRNRSQKVQIAVLTVFSLTGIAAVLFHLLRWGCPLQNLPLHLCSINALLLPFAVVTRNKTLGNMLLLWCLGALAALVLNNEVQSAKLFGESFNFYYFPHVFEFGIPILLFKLKLVDKDVRCIGTTLGLTMLIYTFVHLCNKLINLLCQTYGILNPSGHVIHVNYMFSLQPNNPLTAWFQELVPFEYWYMYMVLPIAGVYLMGVYAPEIWAAYRRRQGVKKMQKKIAV